MLGTSSFPAPSPVRPSFRSPDLSVLCHPGGVSRSGSCSTACFVFSVKRAIGRVWSVIAFWPNA